MHGSLHLIMAHESALVRQADGRDARLAASFRRPFAAFAARVAAAHGVPPRAAPSADTPTLSRRAATLRGR